MNRAAEMGLISTDHKDDLLSNTIISQELEILKGCDLIIEAISEDEGKKRALFNKLDRFIKPECIFTSNSSSILPSKLVPSNERAIYFAGLHLFYPLVLKNVVELIVTPKTSSETNIELQNFLHSIKKGPLNLNENSAFLLNRIFLDLQNEAWNLVSNGTLSLQEMESLIKDQITPTGAFEFCDQVGNDIMLASVRNYSANGPKTEVYSSFIQQLEKLVSEGKLGAKSGEGFFSYNHDERETAIIPFKNNQELQNMIIERLQYSLLQSIQYWSVTAEIDITFLTNAMKEYLGTD